MPPWTTSIPDPVTQQTRCPKFLDYLKDISKRCTSRTLEKLGVSIPAWKRFQSEIEHVGGVVPKLTHSATRIAAVFANDERDGHFLAVTAACGVAYILNPLDIDEWYSVENYVPEEQHEVMDKEIDKEATLRRTIPADHWEVEGETALGIKVCVRLGKLKNRPIWDYSRPEHIGLNH